MGIIINIPRTYLFNVNKYIAFNFALFLFTDENHISLMSYYCANSQCMSDLPCQLWVRVVHYCANSQCMSDLPCQLRVRVVHSTSQRDGLQVVHRETVCRLRESQLVATN